MTRIHAFGWWTLAGILTAAVALADYVGVMADEDTGTVALSPLEARIANWSAITGTPTTVAGYGITDGATLSWVVEYVSENTNPKSMTNEPAFRGWTNIWHTLITNHIWDTSSNPHGITPAMIGAATGTPIYVESDPKYTGAVTKAGFTVSEGTNNSWDAATQTVTIKSNYLDSEADPNWAANSNSVLSHLGDTNTNPHGITRTMLGAAYTGDVVYAIAANGITNTPDGDGLIDLGTVGGDNTSTVTGRQIKVGSELNLTPYYGYVIGKRSGVTADNGMALGYRASVTDENAFVWSDASSDSAFNSRGSNTFSVRASGGTYIDTPTFEITGDAVFGNVTLTTTKVARIQSPSKDDDLDIIVLSKTGSAGDAASINIMAGNAVAGNGGNVIIRPGVSWTTNGVDGKLLLMGSLHIAASSTQEINLWDLATESYYKILFEEGLVYFGPTNSVKTAWEYVTGTNVWQGRVNDAESSRIAALGTPGSGWTNLSITGTGNAITGATAAGTTLTLERGTIEGGGGSGISAAEAGQIATNVASGYLPLSGYDGLVVLGTRTRGYAASTNLGEYGFAAGYNTSADFAGFAAGEGTSAGDYGFAAGEGASAGYAGFAAGSGTSAGDAGFAAGDGASAGDFGFAAGRAAKGADGSFVFADDSADGTPFNRTNRPNEFSARAAGGVYFDTPLMVVTGTVSAGSITLGTNAPITNWPEGGTGTGWTTLAFSGTGNAITGATAAGTTLTLERGTIEGGGGATSTNAASIGVEEDVLVYPFATNIAMLASTNFWPQRILEITNDFTLQVPTMSDTNAAGVIWLTVPSIGSYTATIPTNSPPILGYVPALSTNAESELLFRWSPQATGWRVRRIR